MASVHRRDRLVGIGHALERPGLFQVPNSSLGQLADLLRRRNRRPRRARRSRRRRTPVELACVFHRRLLHVFDLLLGVSAARTSPLGCGYSVRLQLDRRQHLRLRFRVVEAGQLQLPDLLEFRFRQRRFAQHLGHQPQNRRQILAHGVDRRGGAGRAAADLHVRLQAIDLVLDLLAVLLLRAADERRIGQARRRLRPFRRVERRRSGGGSSRSRCCRASSSAAATPSCPTAAYGARTRASMFAGDGSNASPAAMAASPL